MSNSRLDTLAGAFGIDRTVLINESPMAKPPKFIKTGYKGLDEIVLRGGLPRGTSIELAAPPSEGKTSLVLKLAESVILQGGFVVWFDAEKVMRFINFPNIYTGYNIPLIHATNELGTPLYDDSGNPWMIPDPEKFLILDHTDGEDLRKKLFTIIATNIADLIVLDSIGAVLPEQLVTADVEGMSMYDQVSTAKFWNELFGKLVNGFKAETWSTKANKGEGGWKAIKSNVVRHGFISKGPGNKTAFDLDDETHKIDDKNTCLIFINHLKESIEANRFTKPKIQTQTPGGRTKEFATHIRLVLSAKNKYSGSGQTKKYLGKDIIIMNEKSRVGEPYGQTTLFLSKDGNLTDHEGKIAAFDFFSHNYSSETSEALNSIVEAITEATLPFEETFGLPTAPTEVGINQ